MKIAVSSSTPWPATNVEQPARQPVVREQAQHRPEEEPVQREQQSVPIPAVMPNANAKNAPARCWWMIREATTGRYIEGASA